MVWGIPKQKRVTMKNLVAALTLTLLASTAVAQQQGLTTTRQFKFGAGDVTAPGSSRTSNYNLLEGAALNGAAATLTVTLDLGNATEPGWYSALKVSAFYTYSAATDIRLTHYCSFDGTNFAQMTSRSVASGAGSVHLFYDVFDDAASSDFMVVVDVKGCIKYKVIASGTSADAGDLLDLQAVAIAGE
jgi:hypothetical protein